MTLQDNGEVTFGDNVNIIGFLSISYVGGGSVTVCRVGGRLATCSSSLRYKTAVRPFAAGLELVRRLRPITFMWKSDGTRDLGLAAEEVAQVEPRLVTHNPKGEVEGVRYNHLNVVLINAIKEQQAQIEQQQGQIKLQQNQFGQQQEQIKLQQNQIESLNKLVCSVHPDAAVCQAGGK